MSYNLSTVSGSPVYDITNGLTDGVVSASAAMDAFLGAGNATIGTGTVEAFFTGTYTSATVKVLLSGRWGYMAISSSKLSASYGAAGNSIAPSANSTISGAGRLHIAMQFVNGAGSLYCNGKLIGSLPTVGAVKASPDVSALRGFASIRTYDLPAGIGIDEVRISTIARYPTGTGATYTVPTGTFTVDQYTAALYHLDTDGTDSQTGIVTAPPSIGMISVSSTGGTDTISYPTPTAGTNSVAGVALYEGTTSGGESASAIATNTGTTSGTFTRPSPTLGQKYYYVKAYDSGGTATYSSASNEVSSGSVPTANVLPNSATIVYSPSTWDTSSVRALCNSGGYFKTLVSGGVSSLLLLFDTSNISTILPQIAYRIDEGAWTQANVATSVSVSFPSDGLPSHFLEVQIKSTTSTQDRWNSPYLTSVKFTGFQLPNGGSTTAPITRALTGWFDGDSITEGVNVLGSSASADVDNNDARLGFAYQAAKAIGCEFALVGFGRDGLTVTGTGNVPVGVTTLTSIANGITRSLTPAPDFVWINYGTNDQRQGTTSATFQAALVTYLNAVLAATPINTVVFVQLPFGLHYGTSPYVAAVAACNTPSRVRFVDTTGWWSTTDSSDSLHPYGYINIASLGPRVAAAIRIGLKKGQRYRKQSDGSLKIIDGIRA